MSLKVQWRHLGRITGSLKHRPLPQENGEAEVAIIDNEATIHKYYKRKNHVELLPAHTGMKSILVKKGDLRIEGKVVGVIRYCNKKMRNFYSNIKCN
ncbi:MAG: hypothetical protein JRJ38_14575 [Deltaproteobacteria bacterium]|nr:hypothetical protein [Deltaproteobacteria bacterium]